MKTTKLSLRIILIFVCAILISLIPDYFPTVFGDWLCEGSGDFIEQAYSNHFPHCNYEPHYHTAEWHWGYRHWLFFVMGLVLFGVQVISIINSDDKES